jgi:hypothetical protein
VHRLSKNASCLKFPLFLSFQLFERKLMLIETFVTSLGKVGGGGRGDRRTKRGKESSTL